MIIALLIVVLVVAVFFYFCCSAWGLMLAGKVARIGEITFKRGLLVALLSLLVALAVGVVEILIPLKGVLFPLFMTLVNVFGVVLVVKRVLALRFWMACGVMILGALFATVFEVVAAVGIAVPIRTIAMAPFKVSSDTMLPTLHQDDRVLVNKLTYRKGSPQRWDIVVFRLPSDQRRVFMKRVVGLPGESIEIASGDILVNGKNLTVPPALKNVQWTNQGEYGKVNQPFKIRGDCYFVLGENSAKSFDSRFWGCVPKRHLVGQVTYIYWPPERISEVR